MSPRSAQEDLAWPTTLSTRSRDRPGGTGAAGLATTLAGAFGASAKQSAGKKARKKSRKKCKQQKGACDDQVTLFCAQFGDTALECQAALLPCCDQCDVAFGVSCTINAFQNPT